LEKKGVKSGKKLKFFRLIRQDGSIFLHNLFDAYVLIYSNLHYICSRKRSSWWRLGP